MHADDAAARLHHLGRVGHDAVAVRHHLGGEHVADEDDRGDALAASPRPLGDHLGLMPGRRSMCSKQCFSNRPPAATSCVPGGWLKKTARRRWVLLRDGDVRTGQRAQCNANQRLSRGPRGDSTGETWIFLRSIANRTIVSERPRAVRGGSRKPSGTRSGEQSTMTSPLNSVRYVESTAWPSEETTTIAPLPIFSERFLRRQHLARCRGDFQILQLPELDDHQLGPGFLHFDFTVNALAVLISLDVEPRDLLHHAAEDSQLHQAL